MTKSRFFRAVFSTQSSVVQFLIFLVFRFLFPEIVTDTLLGDLQIKVSDFVLMIQIRWNYACCH